MEIGGLHESIIANRPIGSVVNLSIGSKVMAFRLTRKLGTMDMFSGGRGKSNFQMVCIKTMPMTVLEISRTKQE